MTDRDQHIFSWLLAFFLLSVIATHFLLLSACFPLSGLSWNALNLPWIILNAAQGETEGHVPTQLLRRSHEPLQIILPTETQGGDWRVSHWDTALDLFCVHFLWLTMKYCMISGLLLDFSSTSVNTSNTSIAVKGERKKWVYYSL